MKNLFFGENRFVMENPPSRKEIFSNAVGDVHGESIPDNVLAEKYKNADENVRDAYRVQLQMENGGRSLDDVTFENEWRALGHELGATIADNLMSSPSAGSGSPGRASEALPASSETVAEIKTVEELVAAVDKGGDDLQMQHLKDVFNISDAQKNITGTFPFSADGTMDVNFDTEGNDVWKLILPKMKKIFDGNKIKPFAVLFKGVPEAKVGELLAAIYTKGITGDLKKKMEKYNGFLKAAPAGEDRKITDYKITLVSEQPGSAEIALLPEEVATKYEEFKKAAETPAQSAQEIQAAQDEQAKIDQIEGTWVGKLLRMFGYDEVAEGDKSGLTGFQKLVRGKDWFGMFLLGLFGYKDLAPGYEDIVSALPESVQSPIRSLEEGARKSNFGKLAEKGLQNLERVTAGISANRLSAEELAKKFGENPERKMVLADEKALRLGSNYTIGKILKITLPIGGRLIVPSSKDGEVLREVTMEKIDFSQETGLWDVTNNTNEQKVYQFTGVLPKDTMILGKGAELQLLDEAVATAGTENPAAVVPVDESVDKPVAAGKPEESSNAPADKKPSDGAKPETSETAKPASVEAGGAVGVSGAATVPEAPAKGSEA